VIEDLVYRFDALPLYDNHTIYVPTDSGITAFGTEGSLKWRKKYDYKVELLPAMPLDNNGNIYVGGGKPASGLDETLIHIISPDGSERVSELMTNMLHGGVGGDARDAQIYGLLGGLEFPPVFPENGSRPLILSGTYFTSYDLKSGSMLARQKIEQNWTNVTLDNGNIQDC
jgi:hypothetical protein